MFEYLRNEYNPQPVLTVDTGVRPAGRIVADIAYSESVLFTLPRSETEFRARHKSKYWSTLRRKERRLTDEAGVPRFRVLVGEAELTEMLPRVRALFAARWQDEWTSCPWKSPAGFRPYAEAMVRLAGQGRAELAVLECEGTLLSFAYCLREDDTYYFYQHASTVEARFRPYSVGKLLVTKLIEDLARRPRATTFDFMTGTCDYKLEWAQTERPVHFRVEEPWTPAGLVRFVLRWSYRRARIYVQLENPRLRRIAKTALRGFESLRTPRSRTVTVSEGAAA